MKILSRKKSGNSLNFLTVAFGSLTVLVEQMDNSELTVRVFLFLTILFSFLAIFDWARQFFPKPKLPISIKSGQIKIKSTNQKGVSENPATVIISCTDELLGKELRVTYEHRYWHERDSKRTSQTMHGKILMSDVGEQQSIILKALREKKFDFGNRFGIDSIEFTLADEVLKGLDIGKYNQIDVVFGHDDYKPVRKRLWIGPNAMVQFHKPESWPNEKTDT